MRVRAIRGPRSPQQGAVGYYRTRRYEGDVFDFPDDRPLPSWVEPVDAQTPKTESRPLAEDERPPAPPPRVEDNRPARGARGKRDVI